MSGQSKPETLLKAMVYLEKSRERIAVNDKAMLIFLLRDQWIAASTNEEAFHKNQKRKDDLIRNSHGA